MMHTMTDMPQEVEKMISFTEDDLPEILEWKVGKKYKIELEVVQESRHEQDNQNTYAVFVIKKVKAV